MEAITSRTNPLCTHFRKLASSRAYREKTGECLCDSPKLLREAVQWGQTVTAVLYTEGAELPSLAESTRVARVPEHVMASVSPMETPQGVVFSCRKGRTDPPEHLAPGRYLLLDGVQDPGNVAPSSAPPMPSAGRCCCCPAARTSIIPRPSGPGWGSSSAGHPIAARWTGRCL